MNGYGGIADQWCYSTSPRPQVASTMRPGSPASASGACAVAGAAPARRSRFLFECTLSVQAVYTGNRRVVQLVGWRQPDDEPFPDDQRDRNVQARPDPWGA